VLNPATVPFCSPLDDHACAENKCDSKTGKCAMKPRNQGAACDADGSKCTVGDKCVDGSCKAGANSCQCVTDKDCKPLEDGNACTGSLVCNKDGKCQVDASTVIECQKGGDTPCAENRCDPKTGKCGMTAINNKSPCGKGTLCTGVPLCNEGTCTTGVDVDCDDSNPCTKDSCDDHKGCQYVGTTGDKCDDGSKCTGSDVCVKGDCKGTAVKCDAGTPCTIDSCHPLKGCVYEVRTGTCDDGNKCTQDGVCFSGKCISSDVSCDDKNGCTTDTCDPTKGCVFTDNELGCDDGNACSVPDVCNKGACVGLTAAVTDTCDDGNACTDKDSCSAGKCVGSKKDCDDGSVCTVDSCHPLKGCINQQRSGTCDDGNKCTDLGLCQAGKCLADKLTCKDDNACTKDTCDPAKGCVFTPSTEGCDAGNACTAGDSCKDGKCVGLSAGVTAACDDGNACTVGDRCNTGLCLGGKNPCAEGTPCTNDSCHPLLGCQYIPRAGSCEDGSKCTKTGTCKGAKCVAAAISCDDGDGCTKDTCDPNVGCKHAEITGSCDDGNLCTTDDVCKSGTCIGAAVNVAKHCGDGNACTDDVCEKDKGCVHIKHNRKCNDGNWCTNDDKCINGKCEATANSTCTNNDVCKTATCDKVKRTCLTKVKDVGTPCKHANLCLVDTKCTHAGCGGGDKKSCDDGNACTKDSCHASKGCQFVTADGLACDDGDACTGGETCKSASCQGAKAVDCDDGSECTAATCDSKLGCVSKATNEGKECGSKAGACATKGKCAAGVCKGATAKPWFNAATGDGKMHCNGSEPDADNGLLLVGWESVESSDRPRVKLVRYDGAQVWVRAFNDTVGRLERAARLKDGTYIAVGWQSKNTLGGTDALVMHLGADGQLKKKTTLGGLLNDALKSVAVTAAGGIYAVGYRDSDSAGIQGWLVKLSIDAKTGAIGTDWSKEFGTVIDDRFVDVVATTDGKLGFAGNVGSKGGWVGIIGADGKLVWDKVLSGSSSIQLFDAAVWPDGGIAVSGHAWSSYQNGGAWVYDKAGNQKASAGTHMGKKDRYGNGGGRITRIARTPSGRVVYAHQSNKSKLEGWSVAAMGNHHNYNGVTWHKAPGLPNNPVSVYPVGDYGMMIVASSGCAIWRSDDFGNLGCDASGACFAKKFTDCVDGSKCTPTDTCLAGKCAYPGTVSCFDDKVCTADTCDKTTGKCTYPALKNGTTCSVATGKCATDGKCASGTCDGAGIRTWSVGWGRMKRFAVRPDGYILMNAEEPSTKCCQYNKSYCGVRTYLVDTAGQVVKNPANPKYYKGWSADSYYENWLGKSRGPGIPGPVVALPDLRTFTWFQLRSCGGQVGHNQVALNNSGAGRIWNVELYKDKNPAEDSLPVVGWAAKDGKTAVFAGCKRNKNLVWLPTAHADTKKIDLERVTDIPCQWNHGGRTLLDGKGTADGGAVLVGNPKNTALAYIALVGADLKTRWRYEVATSSAAGYLQRVAVTKNGFAAIGHREVSVAGTKVTYINVVNVDSGGKHLWTKSLFPKGGNRALGIVGIDTGIVAFAKIDNKHATLTFDWFGNRTGDKRQAGSTDFNQWSPYPQGGFLGGKPGSLRRIDPFGNFTCDPDGDCLGKTPDDCDDGNPCTIDLCLQDGGCKHYPLQDGATCGHEASFCLADRVCGSGKCAGAKPANEGKTCDDGNPCSTGDACKSGVCKLEKYLDQHTACDDGDLCTKNGRCAADGTCYTQPVCSDGKACTQDKCAGGACSYPVISKDAACDDGDYCTSGTTCDADGGSCVFVQGKSKDVCSWTTVHKDSFDCGSSGYAIYNAKDGVGWAIDATPASPGYKSQNCSLNANNGTNYAAGSNKLNLHVSTKKWKLPPRGRLKARFWSYHGTKDANEAKQDSKVVIPYANNKKVTNHVITDALDLNKWYQRVYDISHKLNQTFYVRFVSNTDGDGNTGAGWFIDDLEVVQGKPAAGFPCNFDSECGDGEPCTIDACVKHVCTWTKTPENGACDDGKKCTENDKCSKDGQCAGTDKVCDDKDPCTADLCSQQKDCYAEPGNDGDTCTDNVACTTSDKCDGGQCRGTDGCNDANICTFESCKNNNNCAKTNAPAGTFCGAGMACDGSGACKVQQSTGWARAADVALYNGCAIKNDGTAWCWGANKYGELGDGTTTERLTPTQVKVTGAVTDIATDGHSMAGTCAVVTGASTRDVWCWGRNYRGRLGVVPTGNVVATPQKVAGTVGAVGVSLNSEFACALMPDGSVRCWGSNSSGQATGEKGKLDNPAGIPVPGVSGATALASDSRGGCVVLADKTVSCWGTNSSGSLGRGNSTYGAQVAGPVKDLSNIIAIEAGEYGSRCALDSSKSAWCWGENGSGQLGDASKTDRNLPVKIAKVAAKVTGLAMAQATTCFLLADKKVTCTGHAAYGTLGDGGTTQRLEPTTFVSGLTDVFSLAGGSYTMCAVKTDGAVYCWGLGNFGQRGEGSKTQKVSTPVKVIGS